MKCSHVLCPAVIIYKCNGPPKPLAAYQHPEVMDERQVIFHPVQVKIYQYEYRLP